jgi:hypothetical protein
MCRERTSFYSAKVESREKGKRWKEESTKKYDKHVEIVIQISEVSF